MNHHEIPTYREKNTFSGCSPSMSLPRADVDTDVSVSPSTLAAGHEAVPWMNEAPRGHALVYPIYWDS